MSCIPFDESAGSQQPESATDRHGLRRKRSNRRLDDISLFDHGGSTRQPTVGRSLYRSSRRPARGPRRNTQPPARGDPVTGLVELQFQPVVREDAGGRVCWRAYCSGFSPGNETAPGAVLPANWCDWPRDVAGPTRPAVRSPRRACRGQCGPQSTARPWPLPIPCAARS